MRIRFSCHGLDRTGYGENARSYVWALHTAGHRVSVSLIGRPSGIDPGSYGPKGELLHSLLEVPRMRMPRPEVNIVNSTPASFGRELCRGSLNLGLTTCEASHIPEHRVNDCGKVDGVMVMSRSDKTAFEASGVPCHVVHPAADPRDFQPKLPPTSIFELVSIGVWTGRKNFRALLTAYCAEFKPDEPVRLTLKTTPHHGPDAHDVITRFVEQITDMFHLPDLPAIRLVTERTSRPEVLSLLRSSDCYVSAHRGEGWGIPMFEAMATGLPTIATAYSGNLDFMSAENSYLAAYRLTPLAIEERSQAYDVTMRWADVDILDLMRLMRRVYTHREEALARGARAREDILTGFTPERTASQIESVIQACRAAA